MDDDSIDGSSQVWSFWWKEAKLEEDDDEGEEHAETTLISFGLSRSCSPGECEAWLVRIFIIHERKTNELCGRGTGSTIGRGRERSQNQKCQFIGTQLHHVHLYVNSILENEARED